MIMVGDDLGIELKKKWEKIVITRFYVDLRLRSYLIYG